MFCTVTGKQKYDNEGAARRSLSDARRVQRFKGSERGTKLSGERDRADVYLCKFCGARHIGRRRSRKRT